MYKKAPLGIKIIGFIFIILGIERFLCLVGVIVTGVIDNKMPMSVLNGKIAVEGLIAFAVAAFLLLAGFDLLRLKPWARIAALFSPIPLVLMPFIWAYSTQAVLAESPDLPIPIFFGSFSTMFLIIFLHPFFLLISVPSIAIVLVVFYVYLLKIKM
jgi:hypothetical protein